MNDNNCDNSQKLASYSPIRSHVGLQAKSPNRAIKIKKAFVKKPSGLEQDSVLPKVQPTLGQKSASSVNLLNGSKITSGYQSTYIEKIQNSASQRQLFKEQNQIANLFKNIMEPREQVILDKIKSFKRKNTQLKEQNKYPIIHHKRIKSTLQDYSDPNTVLITQKSQKSLKFDSEEKRLKFRSFKDGTGEEWDEEKSEQVNYITQLPMFKGVSDNRFDSLRELVKEDERSKAIKRNFKYMLEKRYIRQDKDLFSCLDNEQEFYKLCMNNLSRQTSSNSEERNQITQIIDDLLSDKLQLQEILDKDTLKELQLNYLYRGSWLQTSTKKLFDFIEQEDLGEENIKKLKKIFGNTNIDQAFGNSFKKYVFKIIGKKTNHYESPLQSVQKDLSVFSEFYRDRNQLKPNSKSKNHKQWLKTTSDKIFQEIVRMICQKEKQLGLQVTKAFKEFFDINEKKWVEIIKGIMAHLEKLMKKDQIAVLVNAQRFLLSLKQLNPWEGEINYVKAKNKEYIDQIHQLQSRISQLQETHVTDQREIATKEDQLLSINKAFNQVTSLIKIKDFQEKEIQTVIDMNSIQFIDRADKYLATNTNHFKSKMINIINMINFHQSKEIALNKQQILELLQLIYMKKITVKQQKKTYLYNLKFTDFVYDVLSQRYQNKKNTDKKCEQLILGVQNFSKQDERIEVFKKFMGLSEEHQFTNEILDFYVKLIISSQMSVAEVFAQETKDINLEFNFAIQKYLEVFRNMKYYLKLQMLKSSIHYAKITSQNNLIIKKVNMNQRFGLYVLSQIQKKFVGHDIIKHFYQFCQENQITLYSIDKEIQITKEDLMRLLGDLLDKETYMIYKEAVNFEEFYQDFFEDFKAKDTDNVILENARSLFKDRINFHLNIRDFISQGLVFSIKYYEDVKSFYKKIFREIDTKNEGTLDIDQFSSLLKKIYPQMKDWKIIAMFQQASQRDGSNYQTAKITFEQFLVSACNNELMEDLVNNAPETPTGTSFMTSFSQQKNL